MSHLMATDFTKIRSRNLLGHGPIHSSLVWNVSPEHDFPSGVGVGLVQALVLLTMDPPHGFSQRDHWLHSVKPPSTKTTLCWWVINKICMPSRKKHRQSNQPIRTCRAEKRMQTSNTEMILVLLVTGWIRGACCLSQSFSVLIQVALRHCVKPSLFSFF